MSHWVAFVRGELFDLTSLIGAFLWALVFLLAAVVASRALRTAVQQVLTRDEHGVVDRTAAAFLTQVSQIGIYVFSMILYAHTIPGLRGLGGGLLTSVSVVSIVVGLAAQNTLGNLIAGFSLLLYRPFQVGDVLQVRAPSGWSRGS